MTIYVVAVNVDYENGERAIAAFSKKEDAKDLEKKLDDCPYDERYDALKSYGYGFWDNSTVYELELDKKIKL